jgi:hypothetical protein
MIYLDMRRSVNINAKNGNHIMKRKKENIIIYSYILFLALQITNESLVMTRARILKHMLLFLSFRYKSNVYT